MRFSTKNIQAFQKEILDWYSKNKRDLPWRQDRDPYHILVSEVMLQQTQVQRVIPKYEKWLQTFPNLETLAKASTRDVLLHWSGLGYNRRALYLQRLAKELVYSSREQSESRSLQSSRLRSNNNPSTLLREETVWPQTENELQKLPGIGEYTARALLCFAFNQQIAVVDTNVRKVILIKFQILSNKSQINSKNQSTEEIASHSFAMTNKEIQEIADQLLPKGKAYEWNQALMDYASSMLKEHKIPIPKQSKFKDSDRYFRGQILKRLLAIHTQTEEDLLHFFTTRETPLTKERLDHILETLRKDNFIKKQKQDILLA